MLDLIGTFVFALSGAALGVQRGMDLFGVLVLAFVTAVVGGITRDVLIGAVPPASIASWHNLALAVAAGVLVFRFSTWFDRLQHPVLFFDAAGLGVFAVAGTQKALNHGINWPMAAILGMTSGIGGGMVRDVLTMQVPTVLSPISTLLPRWRARWWWSRAARSGGRRPLSRWPGSHSVCSCA